MAALEAVALSNALIDRRLAEKRPVGWWQRLHFAPTDASIRGQLACPPLRHQLGGPLNPYAQ